MGRWMRWLAPLLVVLMVAAACGDDDDDDDGGGATETSAAATETTAGGGGTETTAGATETTTAVETGGAETILGSGIPSGDACENVSLDDVPGVSDTEIRVGGIVAVTDPTGSPYETSVDGLLAYFKGVNDAGGVCGRQLKYVRTIDDQAAVSRNLLGARELVEEDDVFAIAPVMTQSFGGADYLVEQGVPTFGWNIQIQWSRGDNLFAEKGSYLCLDANVCQTGTNIYVAQELFGVTRVAGLAYGSSPQSASCGQLLTTSFEKFGPAAGVELAFVDDSLSFGFTPEALGPTLDRLREENVELLFTCMDFNANLRILTAMQNAGLSTGMYWPNGYEQTVLDEFGPQIQNPVYTAVEFRPFEANPSPGLTAYLNSMEANDLPKSEYTLTGWINADLLVTGIRAAAQDDGTFDRASVVDAINALPVYTAGGIMPGHVWAKEHADGPSTACMAFLRVDGPNRAYVSETPDTPWTCLDPETLEPSSAELMTFGDEDTGLSTEGVQGTEEAEQSGPANAGQPDDPAAAEAAIKELVVGYLASQSADERLALVANGDSIREQVTANFRAGLTLEPIDTEVTFTGPTTADVKHGISLNGSVLQGITSTAYVVEVDGTWLYHPFAVCDGITQAGNAADGAACLEAAEAP
jgi:ABC-type branched-subunit amino acid transport system substrate-binding protein